MAACFQRGPPEDARSKLKNVFQDYNTHGLGGFEMTQPSMIKPNILVLRVFWQDCTHKIFLVNLILQHIHCIHLITTVWGKPHGGPLVCNVGRNNMATWVVCLFRVYWGMQLRSCRRNTTSIFFTHTMYPDICPRLSFSRSCIRTRNVNLHIFRLQAV